MQSFPLEANDWDPQFDANGNVQLSDSELGRLFVVHNIVQTSPTTFSSGLGDAEIQLHARSSYWSPEEIAALSLGKNPTVMQLPCVGSLAVQKRFWVCRQYWERLALIERAVDAGQLFMQTVPPFALAWLDRMQIGYPQALKSRVESLGFQVADWKTECEELAKQVVDLNTSFEVASEQYENDLLAWQNDCALHAQWQSDARDLFVKQDERIARLNAENEALRTQQESEQAGSSVTSVADQASRASLLKMVLGMALEQYSYEPAIPRSNATSNISSDLDSNGVSLDPKTIRKILKEAVQNHWEGERE